MTVRTQRTPKASRKPAKPTTSSLARLPEWNLADLYPGIDAPEVKRDLDRADADCAGFEAAYKGRLADLAKAPDAGAKLLAAVMRS
jgi:oligoendopeptidase F